MSKPQIIRIFCNSWIFTDQLTQFSNGEKRFSLMDIYLAKKKPGISATLVFT